MDMYGDEEGIKIRSLDDDLLGSFRLGEKVTVTISSGSVSRKLVGTVDDLDATEEYESYDYKPGSKADKKVTKKRAGTLGIEVSESTEVEPPDMMGMMEADEED